MFFLCAQECSGGCQAVRAEAAIGLEAVFFQRRQAATTPRQASAPCPQVWKPEGLV